MSRIRTYFLTGLVIAGPGAVTLWLICGSSPGSTIWCGPDHSGGIPPRNLSSGEYSRPWPGSSSFTALTLLGFHRQFDRPQADFGESLLNRMPIVRPIYRTTKQIFQTLFSKSDSELPRRRPCRVSIAGDVVTGVSDPSADRRYFSSFAGNRTCVGVYALHTQPDHRILFLCTAVPDVIELDLIRVEQAMTVIMSAGTQPGGDAQDQES